MKDLIKMLFSIAGVLGFIYALEIKLEFDTPLFVFLIVGLVAGFVYGEYE